MTAHPRRRAVPALLATAALAMTLAACDNGTPAPPTGTDPGPPTTGAPPADGMSEWIPGTEETTGGGYVRDAAGDLMLTSLHVTTTPDGTRVDLGATGEGELGWRLGFLEDIVDASPFFTADLSGFANPHPFLLLSASNDGAGASTSSSVDTVSGLDVWIRDPVDYRWEMPSPQELTLEFAKTADKSSGSHALVAPGPPPPPPWEGATYSDPAETLTSDAWGTAGAGTNELNQLAVHSDEDVHHVRVGFNEAAPPEWEALYVSVPLHPVTDEPLDLAQPAFLLLTVEGVAEPAEILDQIAVGNDYVDAIVTTDGTDTLIWIGMPSAAPFTVIEDDNDLLVVAER